MTGASSFSPLAQVPLLDVSRANRPLRDEIMEAMGGV